MKTISREVHNVHNMHCVNESNSIQLERKEVLPHKNIAPSQQNSDQWL